MTTPAPPKSFDVLIGGSVGALVIASAGWFNNPSVKQAILYSAPFVSTAAGIAISWLKSFGFQEIEIRYLDWQLRRLKKHFDEINVNPDHTAATKAAARKAVSELDLRIFVLKSKSISVKADPNKGA